VRAFLASFMAIALLAATAACGGSSQSASEQWAGDFCTTVDGWAKQMQGYADDVQTAITSPSADSVTSVQTAITNGTQATKQVVTDMKGLGPPPTDSQASAQVEALTTQLQQSADKVESQAQALESSSTLTELASSIGTIATEVSSAVAKGKSTFESVQQSNSELRDGFDKADSCQQLQKDFS
jgi:hypothetical protein